MAWTDVVYSCGCDGRIQVYGPRADRQRKADWIADRRKCEECFQSDRDAERAAASVAAKAQAEEYDLPQIEGSEKQIEWAQRIRASVVVLSDKVRTALEMNPVLLDLWTTSSKLLAPRFEEGVASVLGETSAKWWIEVGQNYSADETAFCTTMVRRLAKIDANDRQIVLRPEGESISTVRIAKGDREVILSTDQKEADDFIEAIKDIGFRWSGKSWSYEVPSAPVPLEHVVAGIVREVIALRYSVSIDDLAVVDLVRSGEIEADNPRRIYGQKTGKHVSIRWRRSDDLYEIVSSLPGARWDSPYVKVPASSAPEILDLAERLGFYVSQSAAEILDSVDQLVVAGQAVVIGGATGISTSPVSGGIHADLADD